MDKLKSMIIVALLSNRKIILFDWSYSENMVKCAKELMNNISTLNLFLDRVFIEFKKAS